MDECQQTEGGGKRREGAASNVIIKQGTTHSRAGIKSMLDICLAGWLDDLDD